jgi:PQQ enzyme-like repeat protein
MKYWEIIAANLSKAGWSWGCVSAIDSNGRTIWIATAGPPVLSNSRG